MCSDWVILRGGLVSKHHCITQKNGKIVLIKINEFAILLIFCRSPGAKIGADPSLTGALTWLEWKQQLENFNLTLISRIKNPIDEVWLDQPSRSKDTLEIHDLEFAGKILKYQVFKLKRVSTIRTRVCIKIG